MSHVVSAGTVPGKPLIIDLEAVRMAALNLGLYVEERKNYRWYGKHVGDWKVPEGWKAGELGNNAVLVLGLTPETIAAKCPGRTPYELAVIADVNNPGAYTLMYDFYGQGMGLEAVIGAPVVDHATQDVSRVAPEFLMHYRMCADAISAAEVGDQIDFEQNPDGSYTSYTYPDETRLRESAR